MSSSFQRLKYLHLEFNINNFSIYPVTSRLDLYECIKHWPSPACIFLSSVIISLCATSSGQIHFTKLTNNSLSLSLSLSRLQLIFDFFENQLLQPIHLCDYLCCLTIQ